MEKNQIEKELKRLLRAQVAVIVELNYYTDQKIRYIQENNTLAEKILAKKPVNTLTDEELSSSFLDDVKDFTHYDACKKLLESIQELIDKTKRRYNEMDKKLQAFCKRHEVDYEQMKKGGNKVDTSIN